MVSTKQRTEPLAPGDGIVRDEILYLPLASIDPDPDQPRLTVDDELADSIKQHGVLQAIQVRPHPRDADRWMLVDGERRWTGAKRAHQTTIPATITLEVEDTADRIVRQLVRNEGKPLTPVEEALAFKKIIDARHAAGDKKYGVVQLAREVGIAKSTISDRLTLTEIPSMWLELIVKGPLQTSHAPILHRWRKVPEKFQRIALEQMKKDYKWPGDGEYKHAKAGERLYGGDFDRLVRAFFPKFVKPVSEVPGYDGPTEKMQIEHGYGARGPRVYAMDPSKWGPIWRKGIAARRAKEAKKNKNAAASRDNWEEQNRRDTEKRLREQAAWKAALPGIIDRVVAAVTGGTIDDALAQLLLEEERGFRGKEEKAMLARVDCVTTSPTELIRFLAYRQIIDEIGSAWSGPNKWKLMAKRLGLEAITEPELATAKKAKRGKKARAAAPEAVAPFDDAGGVLVDVGEYAKPETVDDYSIVDEQEEAEV